MPALAPETLTTLRRVGTPIQEALLAQQFLRQLTDVVAPGIGRSIFVIREPEVGHGRPDFLILTISPKGFRAFLDRGLRLPSLAAARVLTTDGAPEAAGISPGYANHLARQLTESGWRKRSLAYAELIYDSLAVEAKMTDWRRAIRQLQRSRFMVHRAALLMPESAEGKILPQYVAVTQLGLISCQDDGACRWRIQSPSQPVRTAERLWLLELLVRGWGTGRAYKVSRSRNTLRAEL